jgi:cytochrome c-type biogenesis protein CcmE
MSMQNIEKKNIRLGGMVKENSIIRDKNTTEVQFFVTDYDNEILVKYYGILPDLFRENKGVVVEGYMEENIFMGKKVLAKHDENYMPPEVIEMIKSKEK